MTGCAAGVHLQDKEHRELVRHPGNQHPHTVERHTGLAQAHTQDQGQSYNQTNIYT